MAISNISDSGLVTTGKWDEKLIFSMLTGRPRRKLLFALATGGPQVAADLVHAGKGSGSCRTPNNFLHSTSKHLKVMLKTGVVVQLENPQDRRRPLYALAPGLKVRMGEGEVEMDFEFVVARIDEDGN